MSTSNPPSVPDDSRKSLQGLMKRLVKRLGIGVALRRAKELSVDELLQELKAREAKAGRSKAYSAA